MGHWHQAKVKVRSGGNFGSRLGVGVPVRKIRTGLIYAGVALLANGCAPSMSQRRAVNLWTSNDDEITAPIPPPPIAPTKATDLVLGTPGDTVIWHHERDPWKGRVFALDEDPDVGRLMSFDFFGKMVDEWPNVRTPVDLDLEKGILVQGKPTTVLVVAEVRAKRLRLFAVNPADGDIAPIHGDFRVFQGAQGGRGEPSAVALYRKPDGGLSVFVARKIPDDGSVIWQYDLVSQSGRNSLRKVREFGRYRGDQPVSNLTVDDAHATVLYGLPGRGIWKYHADPSRLQANAYLANFGASGWDTFEGDLQVYRDKVGEDGTILRVDRNANVSVLKMFKRNGELGAPHDHSAEILSPDFDIENPTSLSVSETPVGEPYPEGMIVMGNPSGQNFLYFSWKRIAYQRESFERELSLQKRIDMSRSDNED